MKFCIDAGHNDSGWDTGAEGHGLKEQDITWLIADKLKSLLEAVGQDVVMTKTSKEQNLGSDTGSSLRKRADICNANICDYFVSIHCNAHTNGASNGTEVLVPGRYGQAEALAGCVLQSITEVLPLSNRGVKESPVYVLKHTNCPAILVETAFITNEADSLLLRYRHDEFAEAIFAGICKHCGIDAAKVQRYSYDNTVNQMILDGVTAIENMQFWERTLAEIPEEVRTIIERYQKLLNK